MTYREKWLQDHPDCTEVDFNLNYLSCPCTCRYDKNRDCPCYENGLTMSCEDCWNRELPIDETVRHWILVYGTTGVCPNCHRQDHIDPLAKYCRYCGTRLDWSE